ncbi:hypothetical protein PVX_094235 [Plasmodium vivax]|uniref:Uncharacterized protein n=1 Tax=Plasmodium vivax (strain Salvador I) TaxID=126793 RepID=A5K732_PLAVS|nr:hypothetical protein PVX_094235 [Plasmodium vivax]EDL44591.1 hypothetical protein PVX_094235 [Plasmodium vivax]|eukprot:XP_001614318.1 hypothetical protein [Plasmodium vivax Sal-1]
MSLDESIRGIVLFVCYSMKAEGMEHLIFFRKNRKKNSSKGRIKVKARVLYRGKVKARVLYRGKVKACLKYKKGVGFISRSLLVVRTRQD